MFFLTRYVVKRILLTIPTLLAVTFIVFTINYFTPGDPVRAILGDNATQEQMDAKRVELGLDQPFLVQFFTYVKNIVTKLDFGTSYVTGRSVSKEILERFPTTLKLTFLGIALAVVIGIILGLLAAIKQYTIFDYLSTILAVVGASMPLFWLALMLMLVFSLKLEWFPPSGTGSWSSWVLPSISVALTPLAVFARMTRSSTLEVIRQDYIRTARAKGISELVVIFKHVLKNALIPIITVIGMRIGHALGGSLVTESIFSIPGLGMLMINSIKSKNYPSIQGSVLFCALMFITFNLIVDVLYAFIDPRIKARYSIGSLRKKAQLEPGTAKRSVTGG